MKGVVIIMLWFKLCFFASLLSTTLSSYLQIPDISESSDEYELSPLDRREPGQSSLRPKLFLSKPSRLYHIRDIPPGKQSTHLLTLPPPTKSP